MYYLSLFLCVFSCCACHCEGQSYPLEQKDPLFVGPLLLDPSENYVKGSYFINPFVFFINTRAETSESWKQIPIDNIFTLQTNIVVAAGFTDWLDLEVTFRSIYNRQNNNSIYEFADISAQFGFQIFLDKDYIPNTRILIGQIFPTGKYNNLDPELSGLEGVGRGTLETFVSLIMGKEYYWIKNHPMKFTINLLYSFPQKTSVEEFNVFGGGFGAKGKVKPGNTFLAGIVYEYLITDVINFLCDFIYIYQKKSPFSGNPGVDKNGEISTNAQPRNQGISITPNIEINFNENLYVTVGSWFSVASQNQDEFVSAIFTLGYTF